MEQREIGFSRRELFARMGIAIGVAVGLPASMPIRARAQAAASEAFISLVINSDDRAIYKIDAEDGDVVAKIQLSRNDPEPHGLDIDSNGVLWYCDAGRTSLICKLI